ncbi:MAG: hypothetical protein JST86_00270 [Bacteroidetes bacterium]|nr:hypothetical protein [Bacteroidota bacterium]
MKKNIFTTVALCVFAVMMLSSCYYERYSYRPDYHHHHYRDYDDHHHYGHRH